MARVGCVVIGVIVVSGLFSFWQEYRAEQTLAALLKLLPQEVKVVRDGKAMSLAVTQLVPGDIVLLEQGDNIPADCRLIEAFGVRVNTATITGESLPKARDAEPSAADELIHSRNILLTGTSMVVRRSQGRGLRHGHAHGIRQDRASRPRRVRAGVSPLRREIAHLSRWIAILAVLIGLVFFAIGWVLGVPFWDDFIFAIGLIVAMVPEGLLPTLTLALVLATERLAKRNVLIRYLPSVEALGSTTVICTDKTGTLTQNRMTVKRLFLGDALDSLDLAAQRTAIRRAVPAFLPDRLPVPRSQRGRAARQARAPGRSHGDRARGNGAGRVACRDALSPSWTRFPSTPTACGSPRCMRCRRPPRSFAREPPRRVLPLCSRLLTDGEHRPLRRCAARARRQSPGSHGRARPAGHRGWRIGRCNPIGDKTQLEEDLIFCRARRPGRPAAARGAGGDPQMRRSRHSGDHGHRRPSTHRAGDRPGDRARPVGASQRRSRANNCATCPPSSCDWLWTRPK